MNAANKGYTITGRNGNRVMGMKNGKPFKIMLPRGLEKYTTDILNIRFGKNVSPKVKHELEKLISGEGFTNTWTIVEPNWQSLFQDSLVDHEGRFRERLQQIKTMATMGANQAAPAEAEPAPVEMVNGMPMTMRSPTMYKPMSPNEYNKYARNWRTRVTRNMAARAAAPAAVANAAVANAAAANAVANAAVANAAAVNAVEEEEEQGGANMPMSGVSLPNLGIWRGVKGLFGRGGKRTRKGRKASKKTKKARKASKKTKKARKH